MRILAPTTLGAGPLRQRVRARVGERVLLVGDAAGYVDALTGEGIAVASARPPGLSLACGRTGRRTTTTRGIRCPGTTVC